MQRMNLKWSKRTLGLTKRTSPSPFNYTVGKLLNILSCSFSFREKLTCSASLDQSWISLIQYTYVSSLVKICPVFLQKTFLTSRTRRAYLNKFKSGALCTKSIWIRHCSFGENWWTKNLPFNNFCFSLHYFFYWQIHLEQHFFLQPLICIA